MYLMYGRMCLYSSVPATGCKLIPVKIFSLLLLLSTASTVSVPTATASTVSTVSNLSKMHLAALGRPRGEDRDRDTWQAVVSGQYWVSK